MGEHVIIRGHIFTYAEKAPFVSSGCSLLGALEYDQAQDLVKCHECGAWFHGLGTHIKHHKITKAMYAAKHGLRINGALSSIGTRLKQSLNAVAMFERGISNFGQKGVAIGGLPKGQRALPTFELHNERGRCAAQLIFKLQTLAAKLRHTPTQANPTRQWTFKDGHRPAIRINARGIGTCRAEREQERGESTDASSRYVSHERRDSPEVQ